MKTKVTLLLAVMAFAFSGKVLAQDNPCITTASLFIEPAKAKNFDAALPHYDKVVADCPTYTVAIYQRAEKMFGHFIKNGQPEMIGKYEANFALMLKHFPSKTKMGKNMAKVAQIKFDNKIGTKAEQFAAFDAAYKRDEKTFTSPKSLYTYFSLAKDLFDAGGADVQGVFDLYDVMVEKIEKEEGKYASKLSLLVEKEDAGTTLTSKEQKRKKGYETNLKSYGQIRGSIDTKLGSIADCENLIPLFEKNFDANKNNVAWLRSSAGKLNDKDCDTPLFLKMVEQLHSLQPSAASAFYLGRLAAKRGDAAGALAKYEEAVSLESDPNKKVRYYKGIADNFKKKGQYGKARTYYRKILDVKPNAGWAYLKIAAMYSSSSNNCGTDVFSKRAMNWLAANTADKAARVDPSIAKTARATASSYRQRAPSKTDIFSAGMAGKTVKFNCWVGGSVRVPAL